MKHSASELALQEYIKRLMSGPEVIGTETRDGDVKDVKPAEVLDHRDRDSFSDELDGFYSDTCFSDINNFAFKPRVSTVSLSLSVSLSVCYWAPRQHPGCAIVTWQIHRMVYTKIVDGHDN
jgi:hypothetical protein